MAAVKAPFRIHFVLAEVFSTLYIDRLLLGSTPSSQTGKYENIDKWWWKRHRTINWNTNMHLCCFIIHFSGNGQAGCINRTRMQNYFATSYITHTHTHTLNWEILSGVLPWTRWLFMDSWVWPVFRYTLVFFYITVSSKWAQWCLKYRCIDSLLKRLVRHILKETPKLRVTDQ